MSEQQQPKDSDTPIAETSRKQEKRERPTSNRTFVREFVDSSTKIAVRVQKTNNFRPYYSFVIGRFVEHENGESFVPYVPIRADIHLARVERIDEHSKLIGALIKEATEWVHEQLQLREDEIIGQQQSREQKQIDRANGPPTKPGLKQLSKIDRVAKNYNGTGTDGT